MSAQLAILEQVKTRGWCDACKQWLILEEDGEEIDWLPKHNDKKNKKCVNAHYSPQKIEYLITTSVEAIALAKFILQDDEKCLQGGNFHSLGCGDGDDCDDTRRMLAKALANYFLQQQKKAKTKTEKKS
jgi:hypothetical protein